MRAVRSHEHVHVDLAGRQLVEEREVVTDDAEQVTCRWRGGVDAVEVVARPQG